MSGKGMIISPKMPQSYYIDFTYISPTIYARLYP